MFNLHISAAPVEIMLFSLSQTHSRDEEVSRRNYGIALAIPLHKGGNSCFIFSLWVSLQEYRV